MPAAMPAPMMAPIDEPAMALGLMPSSSSASMTWIWARPRAPPPPNATAKLGPESGLAEAPARRRLLHPLPPSSIARAEHHHRRLDRKQLTRRGLHLVKGDIVDQVDAALDVVDAEAVGLQPDQRAGDRRRRVQIVDGIGADDVFLGGGQLLCRHALFGHALHLVADDLDRLGGAVGAGRRRDHQRRRVIVVHQASRRCRQGRAFRAPR